MSRGRQLNGHGVIMIVMFDGQGCKGALLNMG